MPSWDNISKQETEELQGKLLSRFIREQLFPFSPCYRELLTQRGLGPSDFKSFTDLKKIPFSSKLDICPTLDDPAKPRKIILQPDPATIKQHLSLSKKLSLLRRKIIGNDPRESILDEYLPVQFIATTGRTANSTPFVYSKRDIQRLNEIGARLFKVAGISREDNVINIFPYAPHLAFWVVALGALHLGVPCFNSGGGKVLGTEKIIGTASRMKASVLVGVPGYIYHLLRIAIDQKTDLSSVKLVALGAERVTPGHRVKISQMLEELGAKNPKILGTYGFTEARTAWIECPGGENNGYHLFPDFEIFEIINPETGETVPEGEDGEIVYTCLDWRGSCVMRYRTGDFARGGIVHNICPGCGRQGPRLSNDITRLSNISEFQLTKVQGTLLDLNELVSLMMEFPQIIEWQLVITKRNDDPFELDELHLYLAVKYETDRENLSSVLSEKFKSVTEVRPSSIQYCSTEELVHRLEMETAAKEQRIIDKRPEILKKSEAE